MDRRLDLIFFRVNRNGKWRDICFSDLTAQERDKVTEGRKPGWFRSVEAHLIERLHEMERLVWDKKDLAAAQEISKVCAEAESAAQCAALENCTPALRKRCAELAELLHGFGDRYHIVEME